MTNEKRQEMIAAVRSILTEMNLPIVDLKNDEAIEDLILQVGLESLLSMRTLQRSDDDRLENHPGVH